MIQVVWSSDALQELAELWTNEDSAGRQAITQAVASLDEILKQRGETAGESRTRLTERVVFDPPLGLYYSVTFIDRQMTAMVVHVYLTNRTR